MKTREAQEQKMEEDEEGVEMKNNVFGLRVVLLRPFNFQRMRTGAAVSQVEPTLSHP